MSEKYTAKCLAWSKYSINIHYHESREQRGLMKLEEEGQGNVPCVQGERYQDQPRIPMSRESTQRTLEEGWKG